MNPLGLFITFEGPEGAGKSTQIHLLSEALQQKGYPVLMTREPGGLPTGEAIRQIVLYTEDLLPETEALLFLAARAEHTLKVILPALQANHIVLCDRFIDSTIAYQGYGLGLDLEVLRRLNQFATRGLTPHLTFLLDLDPEVGLKRVNHQKRPRKAASAGQLEFSLEQPSGRPPRTRFEERDRAFHRRVREGYLAEAQRESHRFRVLDATLPPEELHRCILEEVLSLIQHFRKTQGDPEIAK